MNNIPVPDARQRAPLIWVALCLIGIAWASTQGFSKIIVTAGHQPLGISVTSTTLGALVITSVLVVRGIRMPVSRRHLVYYAICGLTGTALPNYTSYTAISELPVGVISIIMAAVPMMTFLAALVVRVDRPEWRRVAGLLLGAGAVLLLVGPDTALPRPGDAIWVVVAMITGVSYAVENVYIAKSRPDDCGPLQTLCGLSWMAVLMVLPLAWATDSWMVFEGIGAAETSLVAMTMMHLLAYGGFVWLIGAAGPVFAAQVGYVVTLAGVFLGIVVFGEAHSEWVWASLLLMFGGLALVQPRKN